MYFKYMIGLAHCFFFFLKKKKGGKGIKGNRLSDVKDDD